MIWFDLFLMIILIDWLVNWFDLIDFIDLNVYFHELIILIILFVSILMNSFI